MQKSQAEALQDSENVEKSQRLANIPSIKWILMLAVFYTLYFAQSLIIPLVLTILIALLLSPLVTLLKRLHIPRSLSSIALMAMLIAPFTLLGLELFEPAQKWAKLIPKLSVQLTQQVESISDAFEKQQHEELVKAKPVKEFSFLDWFSSEDVEIQPKETTSDVVTEHIKQGGLEFILEALGAAPVFLAQVLVSIILILFLLIFGPSLFNAFIKELPTKEKRDKAINLVNMTQAQLSRYIITVSIINTGLGLSTALVLYFIGLEDALLWGVMVGILNFIPYVGSVLGVLILSLAGLVQYGVNISVLLPVAAYLVLNMLESQFITPTVLGRNMLINPLVIMLWLIICGWLWGLSGILLSVPLLVCIKLALSELGLWGNWLRIIEAGG
ncbi:AI-2E family transporter [Paraglaciecola arctica]|uniref:AI-2E family transporter n=1 Tax=Paraglaciecola arctica TaxID=1128911 RepID=UPI001C066C66|nr:AI-2E family transporter [Paraglaciecola arctica]MBU3004099.1 AI-2E family transporter [Paraglaciecola arctica]